MATVELPLEPSTPSYRVGTALNGTQYILDVRWNSSADVDPVTGERRGAWFMDIRAEDEVMIICGIKIVLGTLLGGRSTDPRFPLGILWACDLSNGNRDATIDDLGTRVVVYFTPIEDFAAL